MGAVNRGKAEMKSFANAVFAAFPDFKIQLMSGFTAGNWAGAEWTMSGTHKGDLPGIPATGKSFAVRDMGAFLKQTGLITGNVPPTTQ
jgi:predicted ester cyclase